MRECISAKISWHHSVSLTLFYTTDSAMPPEQKDSPLASSAILYDLSHLGLIVVSGEDAQSFLQGQFANDLRQVSTDTSQINVYCSPKGRALAVFRLFKRADSYYLLLPRTLLDATLKRLRMFVLRARVILADVSDDLIRIGIAGATAQTRIQFALGFAPCAVNDVVTDQETQVTVLRIPGPQARCVIIGDSEQVKKVYLTLSDSVGKPAQETSPSTVDSSTVSSDAAAWAWLDIQAGIPNIHPATSDTFVPQMLNLDVIGGISFTKGCYPGQEIVARLHYLGTLKRRMYRGHVEFPVAPEPGDEFYGADSEQSIGQVVDAQPTPGGGYELLAVLQIAHAHEARLLNRDGVMIRIMELPYGVGL